MKLPMQTGGVDRTVATQCVAEDRELLSPQQLMIRYAARSQSVLPGPGDFTTRPVEPVQCWCCWWDGFCVGVACNQLCPSSSFKVVDVGGS